MNDTNYLQQEKKKKEFLFNCKKSCLALSFNMAKYLLFLCTSKLKAELDV